jgi:prophage regulatory protein
MSNDQNDQFNLFPSLPKRLKGDSAMRKEVEDLGTPPASKVHHPSVQRNSQTQQPTVELPVTGEKDCPYLSDQAVAKRYGVSRPTVWRWVKSLEGFPQPIRISGGTTRWNLADLQAFDRNRKANAPLRRRHNGKAGAK